MLRENPQDSFRRNPKIVITRGIFGRKFRRNELYTLLPPVLYIFFIRNFGVFFLRCILFRYFIPLTFFVQLFSQLSYNPLSFSIPTCHVFSVIEWVIRGFFSQLFSQIISFYSAAMFNQFFRPIFKNLTLNLYLNFGC